MLAHPGLELVALGSDSLAGQAGRRARPAPERLAARVRARTPRRRRAAPTCIFLCLDNDEAAAFEPPADTVVVDLSGAHRLDRRRAPRSAWYGTAPGAWSYGLPELFPPQGPLIANPGCYATAALLALAPLAGLDRPAPSSTRSRASRAPASR